MLSCWAILKYVIDIVYETEDVNGEYIFMRDPNKASLKLYKKIAEE